MLEKKKIQINDQNIIQQIEAEKDIKGFVELPEEFFENASENEANYLAEEFKNDTLVKLPEREVKFFEWLKTIDSKVWDDLWGNDELNGPYLVGMSFLPKLLYGDGRGYPICDLLETDNYYFTEQHIQDEEAKVLVDTAKEMVRDRKALTVEQLLALEISFDPIDIWHFAYKHNISLATAKKAVHRLVDEEALVHLKESEHLAPFIDF